MKAYVTMTRVTEYKTDESANDKSYFHHVKFCSQKYDIDTQP